MRHSYVLHKDFNLATKLFLITIYTIYYTSRSLGIACFSFDFKRCRTIESWTTRLYSVGLFLIVLAFMPFAMYILYTEMTFLRQNPLLTYVGYIRYAMLFFCALATLYIQMYNRDAIMQCVNEMLKSRHILQMSIGNVSLSSISSTNKHVIWNIMAKGLTIILQLLWIIFLILYENAIERLSYFITLLYIQYCHLILVTTLNLLFYGCWTLALITQELNRQLIDIFKQLKWLTYHRANNHRHRLQHFSQQLERIVAYHWKIYKLSCSLVPLFDWQILCFLTFAIIECVTQIFIMYFVAADIQKDDYDLRHSATDIVVTVRVEINDSDNYNEHKIILNPYALLYVFAIIWDIFLILLMIDKMRSNFIKTRFIFCHDIFLKSLSSPANHILHKCLSRINLYLLHLQTCISYRICGLFIVDKHLILRLLETIFLYLLLLIQFDLIIN